jgi:hypothetical protein
LFPAVAAAGCGPAQVGEDIRSQEPAISWERFRELYVAYHPNIDSYVVDGDLAFSSMESVRRYYDRRIAALGAADDGRELGQSSQPLNVHEANGQDDKWSIPATRWISVTV